MKKIFRMALVFALAGATLVYTGCTKDYAEEIDNLNSEIAKTQDDLKSVKEALAKAEALAEAAATKSELNSQVSTLNTAITKLSEAIHGEGGIDDEIDDLWEAVQAIDKKIEEEGGLRDAIDEAKAAIAAIFNQIQSVVFVPEYVGEGIPFATWTLGNATAAPKTKPTAITTFKVTPAAKATEVGTKYKAAVNVAPLKVRTVRTAEAPDHSDKVSVISADPATGYVQVAIEIDTTYDHFAVSLELKEAESKTEIVSDYVPAIAIGNVDLFDKLKLKSATAKKYDDFEIRYDDDTQYSFFDTFSPKFVFNDSEYTREQIAKAFPKLGLAWADTVKVACSKPEAFVISDTTANFPAKVKLAKAKSDSAFNYVGATATATYTVNFTTTASTQPLDAITFTAQTAKIVKSISDKPIVTSPVVFYWNFETFNGTTFADNSLPVAEGDVEWVADDDLSDFVGPINLFGVVTAADFAKADGNIDSLVSYVKAAPCTYVTDGTLRYKDAKNVDLTLEKNGVWPAKDTTYYEVYGFEKNSTQFALAIPVTIKAKPADILVEKYDIAVKKGASTYTFEDVMDQIYTSAFANKLVDGLSGKTEKKVNAWNAFVASIATPSKSDKFFENGDVTKTPVSKLQSVDWSPSDNADLKYTFNNGGFKKYADSDSATVECKAFDVNITIKTLIKAENAPAYALGFINDPRLTISSDDPKNASAYAAFRASTGKPETAYMNQFVQVVRPAGTTTPTYQTDVTDGLHVEFSKFAQTKKDTLDIDDAWLAGSQSFAPRSFNPQYSWVVPGADTLKAYIDDNDPAIAVNWGDTTHVRTIPVKAVLYCDGIALDSVIVNVWTDDPFAGEGAAFAGYNFKFDASEREDRAIEMETRSGIRTHTFSAYDSLTVKSPIYEDNLVAGNISDWTNYVPTVNANGIVVENNRAQYYYTNDAKKLGVQIWVAPAKEWTLNNGEKVIDNPTNFGIDEQHARVTLKRGVKLTEDVTVTIPIKLYYTLGGPISSQVTVTFTK